jgi:ferredoxin
MKIKIDKEKCYKSGECYYNHPELFQMGDDGFPVLVKAEVTEADMVKHAMEASEVCPAGAILLEE